MQNQFFFQNAAIFQFLIFSRDGSSSSEESHII